MKRCPTCSRVYNDLSLRFCLDDGTELVNKLPDTNAPPTAVLPSPQNNLVPTIEAPSPQVAPQYPATPQRGQSPVAGKRSLLPWILGAIFLVPFLAGAVVAGWVIFHRPALTWHLMLEVDSNTPDQGAAVGQTIEVIKKRLDEYGVRNFQVSPQGNGRIMLDLPSVTDPERLKSIIIAGGKLELTHVISPPSPAPVQTYAAKEEAIASLNAGGSIPANRRVLQYTERADPGGPASARWVVVESPAIVDGSDLRNASAARSYGEDYQIQFSLNKAGAAKFGAWTGANIDQYLGVVLNDEVKSIAYIKSQISDQGVISGRFTKQSAEDLALVLRSGALPAPLRFVEEHVDK